MKRVCKKVDLRDPKVLDPWIRDCLWRHKKRYDFQKLIKKFGCVNGYANSTKKEYDQMVLNIGQYICDAIANRDISFLPPVKIRIMADRSNGKVREIGCESAMQQLFDHVCRGASEEIWKRRIVPQQMSSIKGRGPLRGAFMIKRWVIKNNSTIEYNKKHRIRYADKCKYHVHLDCQKCFPNGDLNKFLDLFKNDCGNDDLIWLWEALLQTHKVDGYSGFMIGALPSEWAMQYMLSFVYRYAMNLTDNNGNRIFHYAMWYMDDATLIGSNRRSMIRGIKKIIDYAEKTIGQTIKPKWSIQRFKDHPIDTMGYIIHKSGKMSIRSRDFLRGRKLMLRSEINGLSEKQARRLMAFKGYFDYTCSYKVNRTLHPKKAYASARRTFKRTAVKRKQSEVLINENNVCSSA